MGPPKRPASSYSLFVKENYPDNQKLGEASAFLASKWSALSEHEKQVRTTAMPRVLFMP
jgi:hypothetical protein